MMNIRKAFFCFTLCAGMFVLSHGVFAQEKLSGVLTPEGCSDLSKTQEHPVAMQAPDELLRQAAAALEAGDNQSARSFLSQLMLRYRSKPEARVARFRLAHILEHMGKYPQAAVNYLAVHSDSLSGTELKATALVAEGNIRVKIGRKEKDSTEIARGLTILENVPKVFPNETKQSARAALLRGIYYCQQGLSVGDKQLDFNPPLARQILRDAIRAYPENHYTWWTKVEVTSTYTAEGKRAEAISECQSLLAQDPPMSWKTYLLGFMGELQINIGRTEEGLATLKELYTKYPEDQWAKIARGRANAVLADQQKDPEKLEQHVNPVELGTLSLRMDRQMPPRLPSLTPVP